jgi:hypothetical protein
MTDLTAAFAKPFAQQVAAFRIRLAQLQPTATWRDVWQGEHDRAFMVAGAQKAALLADLAAAVDKAITQGTTLETFRKDFAAAVEAHDWHGWTGETSEKGRAWRTRLIYRTNLSVSYAAGRFAQLKEAGFTHWVYHHGNAREPRLQHLAWDGLILPAEHPFWASHYPPNGWGCTCYVTGARSAAGAKRVGGKPDVTLPPGWDATSPKTGAPVGIDKGWGYAPGATVADTINGVQEQIARLPPQLGSDLGSSIASFAQAAWPRWVEKTRNATSAAPGYVGVMSRPMLAALEAAGRKPISADILVKPGLLAGPKADRHITAGDALTDEHWLALPDLILDPMAVAIDNRTGKLLIILKGSDRVPQIAIELDQIIGKKGDPAQIANLIVSAYRPKMSDLIGRVVGGLISVILGSLT